MSRQPVPAGALDSSVALVPERPELCRALAERLRSAACEVVTSAERPLDLLVVPIAPGSTRVETAARVFGMVEMVRGCRDATGSLPRRVVVLVHPGDEGASLELQSLALALTRTLLVYLTAHTMRDDARINAVHVPSADETVVESSLDVAMALASGLLDGVRGQLFRVGSA